MNLTAIKQQVKTAMQPVIDGLENYEIPDGKIQPVIDHAIDLFAKHHRTMTPKRIVRKTAEYFKLSKKQYA